MSPEIEIKKISKVFGEKNIFSDFSAKLDNNGIYFIKGGNGTGKTTLLRLISGLDTPDEGEISVNGKISYVFQENRLFPQFSALKNASVVTESKEYARLLLSEFGFTDNDMQKRPSQLSGGMRQMVSICRALAAEYDILLLDEPTKELDDGAVEILKSMLIRLKSQKMIVMVSHRAEDFSISDGIIEL